MTLADDPFFPNSERVQYANAPLVDVICQVRFPSILKIEGATPTDFQERVRRIFPLFERNPSLPITSLPAQFAQILSQFPAAGYSFLTEDRTTTLILSSDALSLTTSAYSRWEDFRSRFQEPLRALIKIYEPSFFTRVGLRYTDAIDRGRLGLAERKWSDILKPAILGELALPEFEKNVELAERTLRLKYPDGGGMILLRHGLNQVPGHTETCFVIDFDFYTDQKTEVADAESVLDRFNRRAGRAFRWCITDELHDALHPTKLASVQ